MRQGCYVFLKSRSLQVVATILFYLAFASSLPIEVHQGLYAVSLFIKDLLLWMLPLTVGCFIAHAVSSFEKRAPLFVLSLFLFEAFSNGLSVWYAFGSGHAIANLLPHIAAEQYTNFFEPLWRLPFVKPTWWSAEKGTIVGIVFGFIAAQKSSVMRGAVIQGKELVEWMLTKIFSRLIPLFVLGFVARMYKTELLIQMFGQYAEFLICLIVILVLYIAGLFFLGSAFRVRAFLRSVKALLPAGGIAFSSGCSLSTMPWTIAGTAKNLQDPNLAKAIIPATTNIQQIGDCIANTCLCFLIYLQFYGQPPSFAMWASFSLVFVLARFATAAVIGGAIFIMLPIYEAYLGFNAEMIAIILAFNVILDPVITASNVVANGALCQIFEKVWRGVARRFDRQKPLQETQ